VIFIGRYPHVAGDPVPVDARRIHVLDTGQADPTRQATVAPSISGTPAVGQTLTGAKGTWTLEPNTYVHAWLFAFRWYVDGKRSKAQAKSSLKLTKAYKGKRISVTITATRTGYRATTLTLRLGGEVKGR